jgi:hypothetical protein
MSLKSVGRRSRLSVFDLFLCSALMLLVQLPVHASQSVNGVLNVTLSWNRSTAANVAGYIIYSGTVSHAYTSTNTVGLVTSLTISNLVSGKTYYFAAKTYENSRLQSALSSETSYTVPMTWAVLEAANKTGKQFSFSVTGVTSSQYVVQASTNLVKWVNLQTNTVPFTFVDTNSAGFARRFYRTYYLSPG